VFFIALWVLAPTIIVVVCVVTFYIPSGVSKKDWWTNFFVHPPIPFLWALFVTGWLGSLLLGPFIMIIVYFSERCFYFFLGAGIMAAAESYVLRPFLRKVIWGYPLVVFNLAIFFAGNFYIRQAKFFMYESHRTMYRFRLMILDYMEVLLAIGLGFYVWKRLDLRKSKSIMGYIGMAAFASSLAIIIRYWSATIFSVIWA